MERIKILVFCCMIFVFLIYGIYIFYQIEKSPEILEVCKDLGYDEFSIHNRSLSEAEITQLYKNGIKFISKWTTELECSDFTDLEKELQLRKEIKR